MCKGVKMTIINGIEIDFIEYNENIVKTAIANNEIIEVLKTILVQDITISGEKLNTYIKMHNKKIDA